jgi:CRISPR-associated endonuclease/helicase Cas3
MLGGKRKGAASKQEKVFIPLPLDRCLAKSVKTADGYSLPGRMIVSHCKVVGEVARALISMMPATLRDDLFPDGSELIAAAHDMGKISPTFQKKIYGSLSDQSADMVRSAMDLLKNFDASMESEWGGHAGVSQAAAKTLRVGKHIPEIIGQHHGYAPVLNGKDGNAEVFGGEAWNHQRAQFIVQMKDALGCEFPVVRDLLQARLLAGLTTVSDWIGSGSLFDDTRDYPWVIQKALSDAGYVFPRVKKGLSFFDVFGFQPKETQEKLISVVDRPGVYILEAPMGLGKTEAALYAAYQMLCAENAATGIYFALPTQLTSEKIHDRMDRFLEKIMEDDSAHKDSLLVHSSAWMKKSPEMGEEGNPGRSWFAQGKRGILAPFAVGTIDQALMAAMNVKHGFVRTFGLAGKVVILDEVHSYDSYTGTIMDKLIHDLSRLHCTVILLSATLTQSRRKALLGSHQDINGTGYPLVTARRGGEHNLMEIACGTQKNHEVKVVHAEEQGAIDEALARAEDGQQVLWVENTVSDAQDRFRVLASRASPKVSCGLLHSRFIKADRERNENLWVGFFGKDSVLRHQQGRILVGTQVLEQSLDIDADFLVTRMAPSDMLLQRIGRLWRHENIRPTSARCETWILSPSMNEALQSPEDAFGKSALVYAPYVLCRSLEVWKGIETIRIPGDIREILEATYSDRVETNETMQRMFRYLDEKKSKLERFARFGVAQMGAAASDEKVQTRYSDLPDPVEVLLLREYSVDRSKNGVFVTFLDGSKHFLPRNGRENPNWRETSALLHTQTLRAAGYQAPEPLHEGQMEWLRDYFYLGGQGKHSHGDFLRVGIVEEDGRISLPGFTHGMANEWRWLSYTERMGYMAEKKR